MESQSNGLSGLLHGTLLQKNVYDGEWRKTNHPFWFHLKNCEWNIRLKICDYKDNTANSGISDNGVLKGQQNT